jgi:hypothetical protein
MSTAISSVEYKPYIYIVWGPEGKTNPRITFNNKEDAYYAAKEMARKHIGERFIVMKSVQSYQIPLHQEIFEEPIPF